MEGRDGGLEGDLNSCQLHRIRTTWFDFLLIEPVQLLS